MVNMNLMVVSLPTTSQGSFAGILICTYKPIFLEKSFFVIRNFTVREL